MADNENGDYADAPEDQDQEVLAEGEGAEGEDPELEAIKARVREMEEEAEKLKEMQNEVEKQMNLSGPASASNSLNLSKEEKLEADARSIYVGNVDYSATAEELEAHFHGCGAINRVTILCDKFTNHPKGFAYIEFADKEDVKMAEKFHDSLFKGRQIKVSAKRNNVPGISSTNRPPRGGYRGRGRGRAYGGYYPYSSGAYAPRPRGRSYYRARRASWFSPY